jgi:hypothetical protein
MRSEVADELPSSEGVPGGGSSANGVLAPESPPPVASVLQSGLNARLNVPAGVTAQPRSSVLI